MGPARVGRYRERSPSSGLLRGPLSYLSGPGEQRPHPPLKKQRVGSERSLPGLPAHPPAGPVIHGHRVGSPGPRAPAPCHDSRLRWHPVPLSLGLLTTCSAAPGLGEGTQAEWKTAWKQNPNQTQTTGSQLGRESRLWLRRGRGLRTPARHRRGPPGLGLLGRDMGRRHHTGPQSLQPRSGPAPLLGVLLARGSRL